MCEELKYVLNDVSRKITESPVNYSKEFQDDLLYDFEQAKAAILEWKSHVLRSINQDRAKHDVIRNLNSGSVLVVMDWAMKFLQMKYREKQSDWFGKRGLSWNVSTVISKHDEDDTVEVETYGHIFDWCQQDWFAVCSIFENLIENVVSSKPSVNCVFIRSDEAGCSVTTTMP